VANLLMANPLTRAKGKALLYCGEWRGDERPTGGGGPRSDWRCKVSLCRECARVKKYENAHQYLEPVMRLAEEIARENPGRDYRFQVVTLTVPRPHLTYWKGVEAAEYRRDIGTRALELFRQRIDWFKRPARSSPGALARSSRRDSFALAGWHIGTPAVHVHLLVYGADYIDQVEVQRVWEAAHRQAFEEVKARWRERSDSALADFIAYRRASQVDVHVVQQPLADNLHGWLTYLVDDGLTDDEMAEDPPAVAATLTAWHNRNLIIPYGRLRGGQTAR
jgi:hypothetical protein